MFFAVADPVKWSDQLTAWSTFAQTVVVTLSVVVAYVQYRKNADEARIARTFEAFVQLSHISDAIDRTSSSRNFREDWDILTAALTRPYGDPERVRRESDLFEIANMFSKIWSLYHSNLISREMYLDEYDEYTLFICAAVSGVASIYVQPDYRGLFRLANRCKANYLIRGGRYEQLRTLRIPSEGSGYVAGSP